MIRRNDDPAIIERSPPRNDRHECIRLERVGGRKFVTARWRFGSNAISGDILQGISRCWVISAQRNSASQQRIGCIADKPRKVISCGGSNLLEKTPHFLEQTPQWSCAWNFLEQPPDVQERPRCRWSVDRHLWDDRIALALLPHPPRLIYHM